MQHVQKKFDSDCFIRWLQKWREMLFTTRVVSLLTIVSVFFLFYYESIYCFFLFRISCANLLQTNKNIVHCLNSTQLAGEAPYPDVTYHLTLRRRPLFYGFHFFPHSHSMGSCCPLKSALSYNCNDFSTNQHENDDNKAAAVFNLILPCILITGIALMSFYMPSDSGEKVTMRMIFMMRLD